MLTGKSWNPTHSNLGISDPAKAESSASIDSLCALAGVVLLREVQLQKSKEEQRGISCLNYWNIASRLAPSHLLFSALSRAA